MSSSLASTRVILLLLCLSAKVETTRSLYKTVTGTTISFDPMPRRLAGEILYACTPFGVFIDIMTVTHPSVQIRST